MTKKEAAAKTPPVKSLEELMLNFPGGKYTAIPLAAQWAKVLRRKEEHRHQTSNELLDLALRDVLTGEIDWKDVKKAIAHAPEPPAEALNGGEPKSL